MIRPRLEADGLFLVGLDLAGDRLLEMNVFSPGGLETLSRLTGKDFPGAVIERCEARVAAR